MKIPVDQRFAASLFFFHVDRAQQGAAERLIGKIDNAGGAPKRGRDGAGAVVVNADGAHKGIVEMDVGVDPAGQHQQAAGIDDFVGRQFAQLPYRGDCLASNQHVLLRDGLR